MAIKLYKPNPNTGEMEVIWDGNNPQQTHQEFLDQHAVSTPKGENVIYPERDRFKDFVPRKKPATYLKDKVSEEPNIMRPMANRITTYDFTGSVEPVIGRPRNQTYLHKIDSEIEVKNKLGQTIADNLNESPLYKSDPIDQVMNADPWDEIMYDSTEFSGGGIGGNVLIQENIDQINGERMEKELLNNDVDFIKDVVTNIDSTDYGLFQINDKWHGVEEQMNVWGKYVSPKDMSSIEQISYARSLYDSYGWTRWTSFKNKSYEKYLNFTDDDYKDSGVSMHDLRRIDLYFNREGTSPELAQIAKAIMFAESSGRRDAINLNRK